MDRSAELGAVSDAPAVEDSGSEQQYAEYESAERRRALFRVLACTLVRELRNAGYAGRDLIGFVSTLVDRIKEDDFAGPTTGSGEIVELLAVPTETDGWGRPIIHDALVVLRPPEVRDRERIAGWGVDPLIRASLAPQLLARVAESLGTPPTPDRLDLMVCDPEGGVPFGMVSLSGIGTEHDQAEIAKLIGDPAYRGRGLARAATLRMMEYGFCHLGLQRIFLRTLGGNLTNIRLNEGMGFRFEGVLREALSLDGKRRDVVMMALLRAEFEAMTGGCEGAG